MGYRDDFYTAANIVGYTGDIDNNPTVYFMSEKDGIKTYGRITLRYPQDKNNEGRELVRSRKNYTRKNLSVHMENVGGETKYTLRNDITPQDTKKIERKHGKITITDKNNKIWVFEKRCVEQVNRRIEHVSRGEINDKLTGDQKEKLFKLVTECRPELKERKKMYDDKDEKKELEFQNVDQNPDEILNFDKKVNSNLEPHKNINKKKDTNKTQPEVSLDDFMPKSKKETNKAQREVSLDDFMPKSKKETNKAQHEVSLDDFMPKSKKETNKAQREVSLDDFMPKSKNNPATKVTRTTPNTRIQSDKTNNTRQRRRSSKGPS